MISIIGLLILALMTLQSVQERKHSEQNKKIVRAYNDSDRENSCSF